MKKSAWRTTALLMAPIVMVSILVGSKLLNTSDETASLGVAIIYPTMLHRHGRKFPDLESNRENPDRIYVGKDRRDGELHTSFKLGSVEELDCGLLTPQARWKTMFNGRTASGRLFLGRDNSGGFNYFGLPTPI